MVIATLATKQCLHDLKILFFTLQLWNSSPPTVYVYCDSEIEKYLQTNPYKGKIIWKNSLDIYTTYNRAIMERLPGIKDITISLFKEFMLEKTNLLDWVFEYETDIFFCDADICFLGPLPIIEDSAELCLSPHIIRERDEALYGKYNGGFLFMRNKGVPESWRSLSKTSRFEEQACLEDLVSLYKTSFFPIQNNYGWWRLFQGREDIETLKKEWSIHRQEGYSGISVNKLPLLSIHTHWRTNDRITQLFNEFVLSYLKKLSSVSKTRELVAFFQKN